VRLDLLGRHVHREPTIVPVEVSVWPGASSRAIPKSSTFASPAPVTRMFSGLMSRWMMPAWWAASSAEAICSASRRRSARCGTGVRDSQRGSDTPSMYSITMKRWSRHFSSVKHLHGRWGG